MTLSRRQRFALGWLLGAALFYACGGEVPTFAPTWAPERENATTMEVVAALEAPQVGFEPTTLRLTVAPEAFTEVAGFGDAPLTPLLWGAFGFTAVHASSPVTLRRALRESLTVVARRGYWSVAPPHRRKR